MSEIAHYCIIFFENGYIHVIIEIRKVYNKHMKEIENIGYQLQKADNNTSYPLQMAPLFENMNQIIPEWLADLDRTPKTRSSYQRSIKQYQIWLISNRIHTPCKRDIMAFRDDLAQNHKATTVNAYLSAVKSFYRYVADNGYYADVAAGVEPEKLDSGHTKRSLSKQEVQALMATVDTSTAKGLRDRAILTLMLTTGMRTIEVCRACIGDIAKGINGPILRIHGKGSDQNNVTYTNLDKHTIMAIVDYLDTRADGTDAAAPLFVSTSNNGSNGKAIQPKAVSEMVKTRLRAAGMTDDTTSAHSLRHTCAVTNMENGATIEETQGQLRHSRRETTEIYIWDMKRAANRTPARVAHALFD